MRTAKISLLAILTTPLTLLACGGDDSSSVPSDAAVDSPGDATPLTDGGTKDVASPIDASDGGALDATVDAGDASDASKAIDASDASDASDAADATDAEVDAGPPTRLRVAWFVDPASATGRVDACVAPHATSAWTGPLLGSAGFALGDVSKYVTVAPGAYDVRLVAAGSASCTAGTADGGPAPVIDFVNLPPLSAGATVTLVFTPSSADAGAAPDVLPLVDEVTPQPGKVGVRFVDVAGAASASPLDYGLGGGVTFVPWFSGVSPKAHLDPGADPNGYRQVAPFTGLDTSIQQGGADLGVSDGFAAAAGTLISAFALAVPAGSQSYVGLVACDDGANNPANPLLARCNPVSVVQPGASSGVATRFADFIADPGFMAVDICLKYDVAPTWAGAPLLGPGSPGLVAGQVSKRFPLHSGALFDVRLVAAGSTTCATAVTPDVTYFPPSTTSELATVALTGWEARPEDAGATLADAGTDAGSGGGLASLDIASLTLLDVACGEIAPSVRVVNVAGGSAMPLTANLTAGNDGWSFVNVPYGGFLTAFPRDTCGYLGVITEAGGVLDVAGQSWIYDLTATSKDTLFLFSKGGKLSVLACDDDDATAGACAPLTVAP